MPKEKLATEFAPHSFASIGQMARKIGARKYRSWALIVENYTPVIFSVRRVLQTSEAT
jgi:hypothetical protein